MVHADHVDPDDDGAAVAYAIGRSVGPAVVRNRLRRRLRALMREHRPTRPLRGLYLVGATADAADAAYPTLGTWLDEALEKVT